MKEIKDSCINEFDPNALSVEAALKKILKSTKTLADTEHVDLKSSYKRLLSHNIKSKINVPNYKNSAMDGYAINMKDFGKRNHTFRCVGESFAGSPYTKNVKINEAVKVMTGGMIPPGCNAVIMKELVIENKEMIETCSKVIENQNIRLVGEDIRKNKIVLRKGKEIDEIDMGILASLGISNIPVFKRPIIGFLSTGDELISVKKNIKESQVYDSTRYLLHGLLMHLILWMVLMALHLYK